MSTVNWVKQFRCIFQYSGYWQREFKFQIFLFKCNGKTYMGTKCLKHEANKTLNGYSRAVRLCGFSHLFGHYLFRVGGGGTVVFLDNRHRIREYRNELFKQEHFHLECSIDSYFYIKNAFHTQPVTLMKQDYKQHVARFEIKDGKQNVYAITTYMYKCKHWWN